MIAPLKTLKSARSLSAILESTSLLWRRRVTRRVTLDAGALLALDLDDRRVVALLARARETSARMTIPPTA